MDPAIFKAALDGLLEFAASKVKNPLGKLAIAETEHVLDGLIDQYLAQHPLPPAPAPLV